MTAKVGCTGERTLVEPVHVGLKPRLTAVQEEVGVVTPEVREIIDAVRGGRSWSLRNCS